MPTNETIKPVPQIYERAGIAAQVGKAHGIPAQWEFAIFCLGAATVSVTSKPVPYSEWWGFCTERVGEYRQARYALERALKTMPEFVSIESYRRGKED